MVTASARKRLADPENLTARVAEAIVTPVKEAISKRKAKFLRIAYITGSLIRSGQLMSPVLNLECGHDSKKGLGCANKPAPPPDPNPMLRSLTGGDGIEV